MALPSCAAVCGRRYSVEHQTTVHPCGAGAAPTVRHTGQSADLRQLSQPHRVAAQFFSAKVNALAALTATVNVGVDAAVADKWTLDLSAYWNPVNSDSFSCRLYAAQIGTKRWLYEAFVGHFIGSQLTYGNYLYGGSRRYYKGGMAGLGFSYGYAWLLSKRWNVTAEIGIGVFYMKDTRRDRIPPEYESIFIHHYKRWVVGPSRAEISFNYLF